MLFRSNFGYHVDSVLVDGSLVDSTTGYTFYSVNTNHTIKTKFAINTYTLTINATNGSVARNPNQTSYTHGTQVILTATPSTGYHFVNWSGDLTNAENPDTIAMDKKKTISANFAINTYLISVTQSPFGTISPGDSTVKYGDSIVFSIMANSCFQIDSVYDNGVSQGRKTSYTLRNISSIHSITATFKIGRAHV